MTGRFLIRWRADAIASPLAASVLDGAVARIALRFSVPCQRAIAHSDRSFRRGLK